MPGPALRYLVVGVTHDAYMGLGFRCMCGFVVGVRRGGKIERSTLKFYIKVGHYTVTTVISLFPSI